MIGVSFAGCAGWLHEASGSRGVVMCSPHGVEELCARKSWCALADKLATAGMPTLRFDYHGTGDADGSSELPGRVAAWRASIREAIAWVERELGVSEIVLIGLRTGALLAALEAEKQDRVAAAALLAPVVNGADYVRELREIARIMSPPGGRHAEAREQQSGIDICGFHDHAETIADLEKLTLASLKHAPASEILLLTGKRASISGLHQHLSDLACNVECDECAGFEQMVRDSSAICAVGADLDRVVRWAAGLGPIRERRRPKVRSQDLYSGTWREARVRFGPGRLLAGVLCQPRHQRAIEPPVIFLNRGMNDHIGWTRMMVTHARGLAAAGVPSLRIDCAGIGDSGVLFAPNEPPPLNGAAGTGLTSAVDWMEAHGHESPTVVGLGSGACTTLDGIHLDPRMVRAVLVNLPRFWSPYFGYRVDGWSLMCRIEAALRESSTGEVTKEDRTARAMTLAAAYLQSAVRVMKAAVRKCRLRVSGAAALEVRSWFVELSKRGCELMLIYSAAHPGLAEVRRWVGPSEVSVSSLPGISLRVIEADRNLTAPHAREALFAHLSNFLGVGGMPHFAGLTHREPSLDAKADTLETPVSRRA